MNACIPINLKAELKTVRRDLNIVKCFTTAFDDMQNCKNQIPADLAKAYIKNLEKNAT
jgi:hypothetical protein